MIRLDNREYYAARAECARRLERRAATPAIAAIHAGMAEEYERMMSRWAKVDHLIDVAQRRVQPA